MFLKLLKPEEKALFLEFAYSLAHEDGRFAESEKEMMEAASWGFSLELEGIKQYWFNYDEDNWIPSLADYTHALGIVWGAKNDYATWFGSNPEFIYGIHFLPTGEYLSSYAFGNEEKSMVGKIYQEFLSKVQFNKLIWLQ